MASPTRGITGTIVPADFTRSLAPARAQVRLSPTSALVAAVSTGPAVSDRTGSPASALASRHLRSLPLAVDPQPATTGAVDASRASPRAIPGSSSPTDRLSPPRTLDRLAAAPAAAAAAPAPAPSAAAAAAAAAAPSSAAAAALMAPACDDQATKENCFMAVVHKVWNAVITFFSCLFCCCCYATQDSPSISQLTAELQSITELSQTRDKKGFHERIENLFNSLRDYAPGKDTATQEEYFCTFEDTVKLMRDHGYTVTRENGCSDPSDVSKAKSKPTSFNRPVIV